MHLTLLLSPSLLTYLTAEENLKYAEVEREIAIARRRLRSLLNDRIIYYDRARKRREAAQ